METSGNDETPKKCAFSELQTRKTPISTQKNLARFLLLSNNQSFTPSPSLRTQRVVRNPFESQLYERLHLPMISSPSLFQTLSTPKKQFEWTIEDLSSFNPVNLVPHETQFSEDMDPIREAQAQAAIKSFFSEQKIVPSPQNCTLRTQKIVLSEEVSFKIVNSTAMNSTNVPLIRDKKCDAASQTVISFPSKMPQELIDVLKKYNLMNEDCDNNFGCEVEPEDCFNESNRSMMDVSTLRRKLFIKQPDTPPQCDSLNSSFGANLSPPPRTPELTRDIRKIESPTIKSNDTFGSDMFGELSPIRACSSSPANDSINDISMISECTTMTPTKGFIRRKKGKNLSESFCLLQNLDEESAPLVQPKIFGRFDSGFPADEEESKMSAFDMQF